MANADDPNVEDVLPFAAPVLTQSASDDCVNLSQRDVDESCSTRVKKEFEYNQFFILAETSSLPEDSLQIPLGFLEQDDTSEVASDVEHKDKHTHPSHILGKAEDCEAFHGILESEDFVIVPTPRDLELCSGMDNGSNISPASNDDLNGAYGIDQKSSDEVDGVDKATSTSITISEAQSFLNDIKQNSETRFKILEEVSSASSVDIKADTDYLKTELELIEKLDMKLQQLENAEPSTCSSRYPLSSDGSKCTPTAVLYLRDEKKRWQRQLLLKRALQKLDMVECQKSNKHILRNFHLGPRARYFSLTAFDLEGEDALRMAEIDERLEQFIEIHSQCGSPSLTSATWSVPKQHSVCSQNSIGAMRTPSLEGNASGQSEVEPRPRSFTSSVEDYLSEKKESRKYQENVESIDKRLRELIVGEIPTLIPKEQLDMLISQCMMEQNLEVTMRPFLCLKT